MVPSRSRSAFNTSTMVRVPTSKPALGGFQTAAIGNDRLLQRFHPAAGGLKPLIRVPDLPYHLPLYLFQPLLGGFMSIGRLTGSGARTASLKQRDIQHDADLVGIGIEIEPHWFVFAGLQT